VVEWYSDHTFNEVCDNSAALWLQLTQQVDCLQQQQQQQQQQ